MNERSACDHKADLIALADAYLQDLAQASRAALDRVYAGVAPPFLQAENPAPLLPTHDEQLPVRVSEDPVFATREFDLPAELAGLLNDHYDRIIGD